VSPAEGRTLRDLFEAVFEAGHWSWPTVDAPTRAARRDQAVQDALDQAVALVLRPSPKRCVIGEYCSLHQFVHGAEAEELREHIEGFIQENRRIRGSDLQAVLDEVDARDSAAFVDALPPAPGTEDR
jgi:hypothetical protein